MKKRMFLLAFLALFSLLLPACGGRESISGEVVEATPDALILTMEGGMRAAVLLEEDTYIFGMDEVDGSQYKADPYPGVQISFFPERRAGHVTAADGARVKAYLSDTFLQIDACLIHEAARLADGTVLDAWKTRNFGMAYQTQDGAELLREHPPYGPEGYHIGSMESFDDLSEGAKPRVREFYERQGCLYDLQAELERAWSAYQTDPEGFSPFLIIQETFPAASSEQIFYFSTNLTRTIKGRVCQQDTLCAAFDRETGESVPLADLFICSEEEIGPRLLARAAEMGEDTSMLAEMGAAFQMEFLSFSQDAMHLQFPSGTLPGQEHAVILSFPFTDVACRALLHPYAIPAEGEGSLE